MSSQKGDDYKPEFSSSKKSDGSDTFCKIFIGGIKLETEEATLRDFFGKFGEITDCVIMKDPNTKRSRGFGFITFAEKTMVDNCMANRPHEIDGKQVDTKRAVPKDANNKSESNISSKRLYVSGIKENHTEQMLQDHFSSYGNVEKVEIVIDKTTGKLRGFAFILFDDYDAVDCCILEKTQTIDGCVCPVKKGLSKEEMAKAQMQRDRQQRFYQSRDAPGGRGWGGQGAWNQPGRGGYYNQGYAGGWSNGQATGGWDGQQGWAAPQGGYGQGGAGGWQGQPSGGWSGGQQQGGGWQDQQGGGGWQAQQGQQGGGQHPGSWQGRGGRH